MASKDLSRRDFLNLTWIVAGTAAVSEMVFAGLRFLSPRPVKGVFGGEFNLGKYDQYPPGSVTPAEAGRFYLVRMEDGGFIALYRRCTHLGCAVPYEPSKKQFVCPCHGSAFTMEGDVVNAPAPRPMDLFKLAINEEGEIVVNTSQPIQRDRFDPAVLVYA